jgi:hypothetical protein
MNAHVTQCTGALVEIEFAGTKSDHHLDRTALHRLIELGEVEVETRCRLLVRDKRLVLQLSIPHSTETSS